MINRNMEEALKRAQKKATDADTDPEAYRDRILSAARQAMKASRKDSIEIAHKKGNVLFALDRDTDRIQMFVDGEEIPEERMTDTIADIDGIGKAEALTDKADKAPKITEVGGLTKHIGSRSFDAVLRAASNDAKEASRTSSTLLRTLLMIISSPAHTR